MFLNFIVAILAIATLIILFSLRKILGQLQALHHKLDTFESTHKNLEGDIDLLLNLSNFAEVTVMAETDPKVTSGESVIEKV